VACRKWATISLLKAKKISEPRDKALKGRKTSADDNGTEFVVADLPTVVENSEKTWFSLSADGHHSR
jgi:hypothetical protein